MADLLRFVHTQVPLREGLFVVTLWICVISDIGTAVDLQSTSDRCPSTCVCEKLSSSGVNVDCQATNMTSLPTNLDVNTETLDLSMNTNLTMQPESAFSKLHRMTTLRLVGNALTSIPNNMFVGLRSLTHLHLQGNHLAEVPRKALRSLVHLHLLYMDANRLTKIPANSFRNMIYLRQLRLDANELTRIPVRALNRARTLEAVNLGNNKIRTVPDYAFANLTNLLVLILSDNNISHIPDHAFDGLPVLQFLELNNNKLMHIPAALYALPDLVDLSAAENNIEYLPDDCFKANKKLQLLTLTHNPITAIGRHAFSHLPSLSELQLSEARDVTEFPDLTGTTSLAKIVLDRASIKVIPDDLCDHMDNLKVLDVHSNKIANIPNMSGCKELNLLNLGNNEISSLEDSPFKGLDKLKDLILSYNTIGSLSETSFDGLSALEYLDLSYNKVSYIHQDAFAGLTELQDLNLGENRFASLPTKGLSNLRHLKTFHNRALTESPPYDALPNIQSMALAYAYHCCAFIRRGTKADIIQPAIKFDERITWLENPNITDYWDPELELGNISSVYGSSILLPIEPYGNVSYIRNVSDYPDDDFALPYLVPVNILAKPPVECRPQPGPFLPCGDLFGWWSLRCGIWIVFLLAVLGNGAVLFVSITSRSKMDVTRFLICNLACADLCMGIYLGFLAIIDASTLGEFEKHAVRWQSSAGCLVAGFLGVLSSELSVFTLTVITIERFYAISHAMQLDKRLTLTHTGYIMFGGWLFCLVIASLPLFEISDYRKFAICLPFETENSVSLGYVCSIMIFNAVSFMVIMGCYIAMYVSIRGSHAWNSNDTVVAKRMALLIFTDFFCWAPIIFFSITSAFQWQFAQISLDEAKVLTIFVLPLNSCANPFLYAFFTRQFKKDCVKLCKRIEESSISRHFPSSGIRRPSNSSNRQSQSINNLRAEKRRPSCSHSSCPEEGSSGGLSNNPSDCDLNVKKVHFPDKTEDLPLQPVRSDSGIYVDGTKSTQLSDMSQDGEVKSSRRSGEAQASSSFESQFDDEFDSGPDIVLHTEEGQIYLNASNKSNSDIKIAPDKERKSQCQHNGTNVKRSSIHSKHGKRREIVSAEVRCSETAGLTAEDKDVIKPKAAYDKIHKDVSAARKRGKPKHHSLCSKKTEVHSSAPDLPIKTEKYKKHHDYGRKRTNDKDTASAHKREKAVTTATQTDTSFDETLKSPDPYFPGVIDKPNRHEQINEWRKTSHLSFLWRNSDSFDTLIPKQKSNSLVELTRPLRDWKTSGGKRHSLTSRHEGYNLLKKGNRDSAYEEDELFEFQEGRAIYLPHAKLKNCRNSNHHTVIPDIKSYNIINPKLVNSVCHSDECEADTMLLPRVDESLI